MEAFYKTHEYLLAHTEAAVRRQLMDDVNWDDRLIGIKGTRGVGKTTFLIQYAQEQRRNDRSCLYINMNNFYFQGHSLTDFADDFVRRGGRTLLVDQVFKIPDWSEQLRTCYKRHPKLQIIFTGSSVMRLKEENPVLNGIVTSYNLRGFSFREFLNLHAGTKFPTYDLEEILLHHEHIARQVLPTVNPMQWFQDYLHHGFYPFFLEKRNFSENLLKTMNMMMEVDILLIQQIELKYLSKLKKLLYLLASDSHRSPNVSRLADEIGLSRATVMNYIKYLADARLINLVYKPGDEYPKKPARVLLHNPNLAYSIYPVKADEDDVAEMFFVNSLWKDHEVSKGDMAGALLIDGIHTFHVTAGNLPARVSPGIYYAVGRKEKGLGNLIPLWLFGFLY
ncbi:MAG: ATP-binding protein [Bacteroidaceae bacterium]|nr:ATP-binding protein [Bacteroidaceae bacterium]MBR4337497.1 ATP-binding protein [Bacteroidaceae bacterium]